MPSRREVLKQIGLATTGFVVSGGVIRSQGNQLTVAGQPVELTVSAVSPIAVRVTLRPIVNGVAIAVPKDGALVKDEWPNLAQTAGRSMALPGGRLNVATQV